MNLGFLLRAGRLWSFGWCLSPRVQLSVWRCRPLHAHPDYRRYASLGMLPSIRTCLGFFPRAVYGTFTGAVFNSHGVRALLSCVDGLINLPCSSWCCLVVAKLWLALAVCFVALRTSSQSWHAWCFAGSSQQRGNAILYSCLVSS